MESGNITDNKDDFFTVIKELDKILDETNVGWIQPLNEKID